MVFLKYKVSFDNCNRLGACFGVDIKYIDEDYNEQTVGTMRCAVLDSICVRRYKDSTIWMLDVLSDIAVSFGEFYHNLLRNKSDNVCSKIKELLFGDRIIFIDSIEIDSNFRKKGIAKEAIYELINHSEGFLGATAIFLYPCPFGKSSEENISYEKLVDFYTKLGFEEVKIPFENYKNPIFYRYLN